MTWVKKPIEVTNHEKRLTYHYENMGQISDGYHTFDELYEFRMLYNAAMFGLLYPLSKDIGQMELFNIHKSKRHSDGELCFGGDWFIVMATLPRVGQISNHYPMKDWDMFKIPEFEIADEWDGHTPQDVAKRLRKYLEGVVKV